MGNILDQKYGLFVHHVPGRTVDSTGAVVDDADDLADGFNAGRFADDLASARVQYVIFTAWHSKMVTLWPSQKMLDWDLPDHRVNRDLIGDMITAVKAKGIQVYLYTHPRDGMEFSDADRQKTGWGTQPPPEGQGWNPGADFDRPRWNAFINDIYREMMQRYGEKIDGLFLDEGSPRGDSRKVVDYPQLRNTIKTVSPRAVLIQNNYGDLYGLDKGMKEYGGWREFAQPDGSLWPGYTKPVGAIFTETWWAQRPHSTVRYSPESMFRYTVLQAATNTDGGGVAWGSGPYADGGWEPDAMKTLQQIGAWIDPIKQSIFGTRPSTSYPTDAGTRIADLTWGVATTSPDGNTEYLHVLKPPAGNTLTLPLPADGKIFAEASLVKDGTPVTLSQDTNKVRLTIPGNWDTNDTAIKLTVSSQSGPVALYRCSHSSGDHMDTMDRSCEGYSKDGILGYLSPAQAPGTIPLYRCNTATGSGGSLHLQTTDPGCKGHTKDGLLGYLYTTQTPGTVPLYRCHKPTSTGRLHMDTTNPHCEDYPHKDGTLGYIIN
ncbi:alpha-L-fucosidase [Streptomyces sp. V4I8]|uniref:alpha-L-fucosidase n=1 Tax=Streptomyces sp. V4I8 TaxID=3156469 RepID=UPI003516EDCD